MKLLFIHRSVGHNLIHEGKLRELLNKQRIELDDYDNNTNTLTFHNGSSVNNAIILPGNNTNPDNLAAYFAKWDDLLDSYDTIMVKSCYPNSHIKNTNQLEHIKSQYKTIINAFTARSRHLHLLTTPPLRPIRTTKVEATFANELASWLVSQATDTINVLDYHRLLASPSGPQMGMLARRYRRIMPFDTHPNRQANIEAAPIIADFIARVS